MPSPTRTFVLAISGASGAAYALRTLEQLLLSGAEVHLVVTDYGRRLLFDEARVTHVNFETLCPTIADAEAATRLIIHPNKDVGAVIASGSFRHHGMAIVPCSSASLGAIATGWTILDPVLAVIVALNILWQGWHVISSSMDGLMDRAVELDEHMRIRDIISSNSKGAIEVHDLKTRIADGEFAVGTTLPSIAALQEHYAVPGLNTIRQAEQLLVDDGLIETRQGRGAFVLRTKPSARPVDVLTELRAARTALNRAIAALEKASATKA